MNRFVKNITLVLSLVMVIILLILYLVQKRTVNNLLAQHAELTEELRRGIQAQRIAQGFKKKGLLDLKTQESFVEARIPLNEKDPVSVLKLLSRVATEADISKISMHSKSRERSQDIYGEDLYRFPLVIELQCGYSELCTFLNRILSLDRLLLIQNLSIERKKELLPQLKVTLTLFAYTVSY